MTAPNTYKCYACASGYILNNAGTGCIKSVEERCIKIGANGIGCEECWWPYWFQSTECLMGRIFKGVVALVVGLFAVAN